MKKLLYLVTQSSWGGAQRYVYDLAASLKSDFHVSVAAGEGDLTLLKKISQKGISTHFFPHLKRNINPYFDLMAMSQLKKFFLKEKPDIAHLNSSKVSILASAVANFCGVENIVYTAHGFVFNEPLSRIKKSLYINLERWTAKFKDKIICVSEADRQSAIINNIAPERKLITIHNGVSISQDTFLEKFQARERLGLDKSWKIYGSIANFYPAKGLFHLIHAFSQINPDKNTKLVLVGDGSADRKMEMESLIKLKNLEDSVVLKGEIPDAYIYLKAFDYFVLSSVKEGLPYVILEAMSANLPIVSTDVGGIKEVMKEDGSHIFAKPKDIFSLTQGLKKISGMETVTEQKPPSLADMLEKTVRVYLS